MAGSRKVTLARILAVATNTRPPYRLGNKVLIGKVAGELGMRVSKLAPLLIALQERGEISLVRIDLVQAFDAVPYVLKKSWVSMPGFPENDGVHGWQAIDLAGVR